MVRFVIAFLLCGVSAGNSQTSTRGGIAGTPLPSAMPMGESLPTSTTGSLRVVIASDQSPPKPVCPAEYVFVIDLSQHLRCARDLLEPTVRAAQ